MRTILVRSLLSVALMVLCMGSSCRNETAQAVVTTFLNELAVAAADAIVSGE